MYSKIDALFWSDEKTRAMSPDARYIVLYLLTSPHRNILGCYHLPKLYIMADTKLSQNKFNAAWKEVQKSGMVKYDEASEMILVCNFIKYNPLENPNQVKGAISKLKELPETPFFAEIAEILSNESSKADLRELINALYERSGMDMQAVAERVSERVTERVKGTVTERDLQSVPNKENSNSISNYIHDEEDISVYPDTRAHAHEEIPEEAVVEYIEYSETANSTASDTEPNEAKRYIKAAWKYHTGRSPNATNIDDLLCTASANSMQMAAISEAIRCAARNAGGSITGYAVQCLKDWASKGLHTLSKIFESDIAQSGL